MTDQELQQLVASNARTIQAMLEQQETSRLQHEDNRLLHEEQMSELRQAMLRLARVEEGLVNMMVSIDEDRPTVLRRLTSIENKVDRILEKDNGIG
jgi:acetyl-CoA carboxylase carboxyltransferase component